MASFTSSSDFGQFITTIRSLTSASRKTVEDLGGPSERQQQDIESGKDMPITDRTCDQYSTFLQQRETRGGVLITRPFFEAACSVFRGVQHTPELGWEDAPLYPGAGFMLGDLAKPEAAITAGSLVFPTARDACARSFADLAGGTTAFTRMASRIATRHDAITVMPWPVALSNNFTSGAPWPSHYTYRIGIPADNGFPRILIDPLRGVSDLEQAYLRATALGAAGADRTCLAWAVLLANGVAAQSGQSPLQTWINMFSPDPGARAGWSNLMKQLHSDTGITTTLTLDDVISTAQRYLLPWVEEWLAASGLHFVASPGDAQVTWALNTAGHRSIDWDSQHNDNAPVPQLWFCDPTMTAAVSAVLNDRRTGNFVLDETALAATGSQHPQFVWCPLGSSGRHALLQQAGTDQWRPAVLY
ncbi:hypothetical protein [Mycobacteroides abscessus]|uniref:hypothetical protein n=1 Tax=Mycobacteroides abscessus TaxID=36809 RepID=UPI001F3F0403